MLSGTINFTYTPPLRATLLVPLIFLLPNLKSRAADTILGRHSSMEIRTIHLGGMFHAEEEVQMTSMMPNFVGQIQGLVYNGHR